MILSLIFFAIAAMLNAAMDVCSHRYYKSIFKKWKANRQFFDANVSWENKYIGGDPALGKKKIPVQLTDAWHLFKTLMIVFLCLSVVSFKNTFPDIWYYYVLIVGIYGTTWNVTFSHFYDRILIAKK